MARVSRKGARRPKGRGRELAILEAVVNRLIPGGDGFPAASAVGVARFVIQFAGTDADLLRKGLRKLDTNAGGDFVAASRAAQVRALEKAEREQPEFFQALRALTYHGYWSRPAVIEAVQRELNLDYHGPPQPYGYSIEPWDKKNPLMYPAKPRGWYKKTQEMKRVPGIGKLKRELGL